MRFLKRIKNKLGLSGVRVKLRSPKLVSKLDKSIDGVAILTAKSEHEIVTLTARFIKKFATGNNDNKKSNTIELGKKVIGLHFIIKPGETKKISFTIPFEWSSSNRTMNALGNIANFSNNNETSGYHIDVKVNVRRDLQVPSDYQEIRVA